MNPNYVFNPLAVFYKEGNWRVSKMSPMYNLQYDSIRLKQYALNIRQALVSNIVTNSNLRYEVTFKEIDWLRYSEEDAIPLMITVTSMEQETTNVNKKKVYRAIFMSWGVFITLDNAIHLPYMLEKGEQRVGNVVRSTLQNLFDCNINQYNFTQHQLLQFCFKFMDYDNSNSTDAFTLRYKTPDSNHKDKLSLTFEIGDIHTIWNGVKNDIKNEHEAIPFAYQLLQNQIHNMFTLDITIFDLCEIDIPIAGIKDNGLVTMKTPEMINSVFTVLNKITSNLHLD